MILYNKPRCQHSPISVTKRGHDISQHLFIVNDIIVGQEHLVYLAGCRLPDLQTQERQWSQK